MGTIKVLMVGGRRCGKTSALASMFDLIINGPVNDFFTVVDSTVYEKGKINIKGEPEDQDTLDGKKLELKNNLETPNTNVFLVDDNPTYNVWKYRLKLHIPGKPRHDAELEFVDCAGEYFQSGLHDTETNALIARSDVFIVMVDTPYLMEAKPSVRDAVNCVDSIHNFLSHINNDEGEKCKMVIFVPIKCEKWANEGRLKEVNEQLRKVYDKTIKAMSAYNNMNVAILPIQTAGNIYFSEMREAYTLSTPNSQTPLRCCKLSDKLLRMGDGTMKKMKPEYYLNTDIHAKVAENINIIRPYAWYHINVDAQEPLYAPHNCEQLPLHILVFMLKKLIREANGRVIPDWLWRLFFGGMTQNELEDGLNKIRKAHLIKENVDGIEYIKKDI